MMETTLSKCNSSDVSQNSSDDNDEDGMTKDIGEGDEEEAVTMVSSFYDHEQ